MLFFANGSKLSGASGESLESKGFLDYLNMISQPAMKIYWLADGNRMVYKSTGSQQCLPVPAWILENGYTLAKSTFSKSRPWYNCKTCERIFPLGIPLEI